MIFTNLEDWWEIEGSDMKNEPGENINDTELPLRVARAVWVLLADRYKDKVLNVFKDGSHKVSSEGDSVIFEQTENDWLCRINLNEIQN